MERYTTPRLRQTRVLGSTVLDEVLCASKKKGQLKSLGSTSTACGSFVCILLLVHSRAKETLNETIHHVIILNYREEVNSLI